MPTSVEDPPLYTAFISYSHKDKTTADWLHRKLESYVVPSRLVGRVTPNGPVRRRLNPIFRDRDELPASDNLGRELQAALRRSKCLIVLCSPAAAKSRWVNEEIAFFKNLHGDRPVLALIAGGQPGASDIPGREGQECFPPALRYTTGSASTAEKNEPIAANCHPEADGRRLAILKIVAGVTGLRLDELIQREAQRRARRLTAIAVASMSATVLASALALYANAARLEADAARKIADKQSAAAKAASDYLVDTFELSNPSTQNPRTVTALSILSHAAERADRELSRQPEIRVRLLDTIARAYNHLGLLNESSAVLENAMPTIRASGPDGAAPLLTLARVYRNRGELNRALENVRRAEQQLGPDPKQFNDQRGYLAETTGLLDYDAGKLPEAEQQFNIALTNYANSPIAKPEDTARALNNIGLVESDRGRYADAQASMIKALHIYQKTLGEKHLFTAQTYMSLSKNALLDGQNSDAEVYARKASDIFGTVLDPENSINGDIASLRGQIYNAERRYQLSVPEFQRAIDIYRKSYGGPHYIVGITDVYMALAQSGLGRNSAALSYLDDAKVNYAASYKTLNPNDGDLLVNRAIILSREGRRDESTKNCDRGLDIIRRTMGTDAAFYKQNVQICETLNRSTPH